MKGLRFSSGLKFRGGFTNGKIFLGFLKYRAVPQELDDNFRENPMKMDD